MRRVRSSLLLAILLAPALRAQDAAWRTADFPGFKVYSDVPAPASQPMLHALELVNADLDLIWPLASLRTAPPQRVVLCLRAEDFKALNPGLNDQDGGIERGYKVGTVLPNGDVMINFGSPRPEYVVPGGYSIHVKLWGPDQLQEAYRTRFLGFVGERVPPWLNHGLTKLMNLMHCGETGIEFPALQTDPTLPVRARTHGSAASLQAALAAGQFLTLPQLFETQQDPKAKREACRNLHLDNPRGYWGWGWVNYGTFDDEAYEFARYCLFGAEGRHRDAFRRFAEAASNGPLDEAGFQRFFGEDYQTMLQEFWSYTACSRAMMAPFSSMGLAIRPAAKPVAFRPATAAEIEQMKAGWLQRPSRL